VGVSRGRGRRSRRRSGGWPGRGRPGQDPPHDRGLPRGQGPHLDYPAALAAGWPIATGVIEGACRYLVKDRMDITGARCGTETAEAILQLRALLANGDFDAYWTWHQDREHERNYPRPYALAA